MTLPQMQHQEQRVAVFIDVQNMYHSARNLHNARVNFKAVVDAAVAGRKLHPLVRLRHPDENRRGESVL